MSALILTSEIVTRLSWGQMVSPPLSVGLTSPDGSLESRGSTGNARVLCRAIPCHRTVSGFKKSNTGSELISVSDTDSSKESARNHSGSSMSLPRNTGVQIITGDWISPSSGKNPQYLSGVSESHQSTQVS